MPDTDGAGRCVRGAERALSGRIRLFTASQRPCCHSHTLLFLAPRCGVGAQEAPAPQGGREGPREGDARGPLGDRTHTGGWPWEMVPRDQPVGREGRWKLSCWRPFALLYPKPTKGSLRRAVHASSQPLGGPALPRVCASRPSTGAGDCCRTGHVAVPAVAAGACDIAMGLHEDVVALM